MRGGFAVACLLVLAATAHAQPKPVGAYSPYDVPAWVTFGTLASFASDAELAEAAARSRRTGFLWIVQAGFDTPAHVYAEGPAQAMRARLEAAGLWPYVIAVTWGEEWNEHCIDGKFAAYGVSGAACVSVVYDWLSVQHEALARVTGKPVLWVTTLAHRRWRPVPRFTHYVAIDAYPVDGQSFADHLPTLLSSESGTDLPLVIVPRWFKATGPVQGGRWQETSESPVRWAEGYAALLQRPRWVAMLGFLWRSRPWADLIGLGDMPEARRAVERSLGVAQ